MSTTRRPTLMSGATRMRTIAARLMVLVSASLIAGCTYGPIEHAVRVTQVVRLGDSYHAVVVVRRDAYRRPTGLSAFPDGGRWMYVEREAIQHLGNAREPSVVELARETAPDEVWESFDAWIAGIEGDSVAYLRLTGCPRDGECYPPLGRSVAYRLLVTGQLTPIPSVPADVALPGEMAGRRPGEVRYVRFGARRDTVTARFDESGPDERIFVAEPDGTLAVVER